MRQMMKRRLEDVGLPNLFLSAQLPCHMVTDLLNQNVPLEDVQDPAGHSSATPTRVYDRRRRKVTRNIVERISI
jgi:integrase/recombinase XerD